MPTLTLLCGLPGSGKTTYARQLETAGAVRFSADDWMVPLFGQHLPREVFDARLRAVKALQWDLTCHLLGKGLDVVLDYGFWTRADRDEYRAKAEALGALCTLVYFDVPLPERRQRIRQRNSALPSGTYELDDAALDLFASRFEPPHADEHAVTP